MNICKFWKFDKDFAIRNLFHENVPGKKPFYPSNCSQVLLVLSPTSSVAFCLLKIRPRMKKSHSGRHERVDSLHVIALADSESIVIKITEYKFISLL